MPLAFVAASSKAVERSPFTQNVVPLHSAAPPSRDEFLPGNAIFLPWYSHSHRITPPHAHPYFPADTLDALVKGLRQSVADLAAAVIPVETNSVRWVVARSTVSLALALSTWFTGITPGLFRRSDPLRIFRMFLGAWGKRVSVELTREQIEQEVEKVQALMRRQAPSSSETGSQRMETNMLGLFSAELLVRNEGFVGWVQADAGLGHELQEHLRQSLGLSTEVQTSLVWELSQELTRDATVGHLRQQYLELKQQGWVGPEEFETKEGYNSWRRREVKWTADLLQVVDSEALEKEAAEIRRRSTVGENLKVFVEIIAAKDLKGKSASGLASAFCTIEYNNEVFETQVIKDSLNPVWEEHVTL